MLLESGLLEERLDHYALTSPLPPLAIPNTLQDSLMARLDRLSAVKSLAQLCAALGREFTYALLQAVSSWDNEILQQGLDQLVAAEFLYQQGSPPEATYRFKHALIQDTAYQSLLKSTRQQHHQRIADALESAISRRSSKPNPSSWPTTTRSRAHRAGRSLLARRRRSRAAAVCQQEAANHANRGLELLGTLPDTPATPKQELRLQLSSAPPELRHRASFGRARVRPRSRAGAPGGYTAEMFPALSGRPMRISCVGTCGGRGRWPRSSWSSAEPPTMRSLGGGPLDGGVRRLVAGRHHRRARPQSSVPGAVQPGPPPCRHRRLQPNPGIVCGYLDALAAGCWVTPRRRSGPWTGRWRTRGSSASRTASVCRSCSPLSSLNCVANPGPRGHEPKRHWRFRPTRPSRVGAVVSAPSRVGPRPGGRRGRRYRRHPRGDGSPSRVRPGCGVALVPGAAGRRVRRARPDRRGFGRIGRGARVGAAQRRAPLRGRGVPDQG